LKKALRIISIVLMLVMVMSIFANPAVAGRGRGRERGRERRNVIVPEVQYIDAEVRVINGQPGLRLEAEEGYVTYEFPWLSVALVDGKEVALERQGDYFVLPIADGHEKINIEDFKVAMVAGQLVLTVKVNPWWLVPIAVATAALKAAGVAITTAMLKAATLLIAAGKSVTIASVNAVIAAWPIIETALRRAGINVTWWAIGGASWSWMQGNCIVSGRRTPDGHFGDMLCAECARSIGQFFGAIRSVFGR